MNNKLLRVLEQLEAGDHASLVCEVPGHLLRDIHIDESGEVDMAGLLTLCQHVSSKEVSSLDGLHHRILTEARYIAEEEEFERSSFWYRMIYDRSLAVNQNAVKQ
jgi:hypothetical protein